MNPFKRLKNLYNLSSMEATKVVTEDGKVTEVFQDKPIIRAKIVKKTNDIEEFLQ